MHTPSALHVHICTQCTLLYFTYTFVLHVHTSIACTHLYCMYTPVLNVHICPACTQLYCTYTSALQVRTSTARTHLYRLYVLVMNARNCTARTHLYYTYTPVLRVHSFDTDKAYLRCMKIMKDKLNLPHNTSVTAINYIVYAVHVFQAMSLISGFGVARTQTQHQEPTNSQMQKPYYC